ncbi:MAG: hypothetical protein ACTHJT_12685 [Cytophaga sp.]|uniref:hypothetical protein n=1 Tax=Cytophaga sp. TaxID=29535 RepID=UPI003F7E8E77
MIQRLLKILQNIIVIIAEVIALNISIIWYLNTEEFEPIIGIVLMTASLVSSLISKIFIKSNTENFLKDDIECVSIGIDNKKCAWEIYDNVSNAFINNDTNKSPFPIFTFSLINHSTKTILLKEINLNAKHLYSGLSGLPKPGILKTIAKFKIRIPTENETSVFKLDNEIEIPSGRAFKFQIEVHEFWNKKYFPIEGRKVLFFTFHFNNEVAISLPKIFLNCKSEEEKMKISILS